MGETKSKGTRKHGWRLKAKAPQVHDTSWELIIQHAHTAEHYALLFQ